MISHKAAFIPTMARYECTLPSDLLERAVTELNEPRENEQRLAAIDRLRKSFDSVKHGPLVREDDEFLLRFLRAKKFDHQKALKVLHNYHSIKKDLKHVYDKVDNPVTLQSFAEKGVISFLDGETAEGALISMYRPGLMGKEHNLYDLMAYGVISMEKILESEKVQICGIATVEDLENFPLSLFLQVSPFELAKLNSIFQDAMPIRFRAIYIINEGKIFDILMAMFKPFLKKKIIKRIQTFGNKYTQLHEVVSHTILPPCYGGTGPHPEILVQTWIDRLTEDWPQETAL